MKKILLFMLILFLFSCSKNVYKLNLDKSEKAKIINFPKAKFAIISDLHYYDKALGVDGKAFLDYLEDDRKLLVESEEILDKVIDLLIKEKLDFIIIPGDLTKDGEKINHEKVSKKLEKLVKSGKKVYVINGNHDLYSGHSFKYVGDTKERIESITKEEFIKFYKNLGYNDAIDKDLESLSYVVEPVNGLWVLVMDSCMWYNNNLEEEPITEGEFRKTTVNWIEEVLKKAQKENKAVIGVMHHGILPHYKSNKKYYPEYVVNHNDELVKLFIHYRLNYVFTGHFHSQDITSKFYTNDSFIYDIETGSLVTHPCPYRIVEITEDQKMVIKSNFIKELDSREDFIEYALTYLIQGTIKKAEKKLRKFKVPEKDILNIGLQVALAYSAHLQGDENPPEIIINTKGLNLWSKIVIGVQKDLIEGWWNDLPPEDNELIINLIDGKTM